MNLGTILGTKSPDSGISDVSVLGNRPGFNFFYMTSVVGMMMFGVDYV